MYVPANYPRRNITVHKKVVVYGKIDFYIKVIYFLVLIETINNKFILLTIMKHIISNFYFKNHSSSRFIGFHSFFKILLISLNEFRFSEKGIHEAHFLDKVVKKNQFEMITQLF